MWDVLHSRPARPEVTGASGPDHGEASSFFVVVSAERRPAILMETIELGEAVGLKLRKRSFGLGINPHTFH